MAGSPISPPGPASDGNDPTPASAPRRVPALGYDDFEPGAVFESYRRSVTESDIVGFTAFAGLKLPIFIDDEFARSGPYGSRIAPGFLTASISAGMLESVLGPDTLAGLGMDEFRFSAPVRPGDTLRARVTVLERKPTREPGRGVVSVSIEVLNQRDECPLRYRTTVLMGRG